MAGKGERRTGLAEVVVVEREEEGGQSKLQSDELRKLRRLPGSKGRRWVLFGRGRGWKRNSPESKEGSK